ncbi:MAG: QueT transporter family protein [Erysipelotrichaceae bacterium]|nr:QueT transporter family protein [Erysipelotrichaceae bacterium]
MENTSRTKLRRMVRIALISGAYVVLNIVLAPISYGPLQFRIAEALTLWAIFGYDFAFGLTLGCALSNFIGVANGSNPAGMMDVLFGSLATLIAGILCYHFRNIKTFGQPILSASMAAVVNAIIIPLELVIAMDTPDSLPLFAAQVFLGEAVVVFLLGLPLYNLYVKRIRD